MRFREFAITFCLLVGLVATPCFGMIRGGTTEPTTVQGLPAGSLPLANLDTRIAWWEGPPFGGGQYHFDYAGDTDRLQDAIDLFARIDTQQKRVVIQDGQQTSFWLGITEKKNPHFVDWQFVVWVPSHWQRLSDAKAGLLPPGEEGTMPATVLTVFVTKRIDWSGITVPDGLTVDDQRLEFIGLEGESAALKGTVVDPDGQPIENATISVSGSETTVTELSDAEGNFLVASIPAGGHRVTVAAAGYASRDLYHRSFRAGNFQRIDITLAPAVTTRVVVTNVAGDPLADVRMRVARCTGPSGDHYRLAGDHEYTTDADGRFSLRDVPSGTIRFMCRSPGFYYNSVLNRHQTDKSPLKLVLQRTGDVKVLVVDAEGAPVTAKYVVEISEQGTDPDLGDRVGSWGGSANIGPNGAYTFKGVPAGKYVISGKPNPGRTSDRTAGVNVSVKGQDSLSVTLTAK